MALDVVVVVILVTLVVSIAISKKYPTDGCSVIVIVNYSEP